MERRCPRCRIEAIETDERMQVNLESKVVVTQWYDRDPMAGTSLVNETLLTT